MNRVLPAGLVALLVLIWPAATSWSAPANVSHQLPPGPLPVRIHVFEDFETTIEQRWWLRGIPETNNMPAGTGSTQALRAVPSRDFDRKMGDPGKTYKAVVFNPVPGPPMADQTHLAFRYWLKGTDQLRVQIFSLSRGYHRFLTLTNLPQQSWQHAAVNMTQARRPDGSGGPLSRDERIDDIQFYVAPEAELLIDDIVLYERPSEFEPHPFPRRMMFTGWFDTGKQGKEWPGEFLIEKHQPPLTWDAAKSVPDKETGQPHLRIGLRGQRPLSATNRLRFRYRVDNKTDITITLRNTSTGQTWSKALREAMAGGWSEATVDFPTPQAGTRADELRFTVNHATELLLDDVLLFEPGRPPATARLSTSQLHIVAVDNRAYGQRHRAGYNGIAELAPEEAPGNNLFVPLYAGLNFEHIFSGDKATYAWDKFEPRRAPMFLELLSRNHLRLHQERTEHWPLRSAMTFRTEGDAIDFRFCATPLADAWDRHGYIGLFFASYIDQPEDMAIQFIGRSRPGRGDPTPRWIRHLPPSHGVAANHRPVGSAWDPPLDDGFEITLASGHSDYEYLHPFYFGRSGPKMFLLMFRRPGPGGELRLAQSPSGGGRGNPAWDFIYYQMDYKVNREFCFEGRAIYRDFKDREEAVRLYETWSGEKVSRP